MHKRAAQVDSSPAIGPVAEAQPGPPSGWAAAGAPPADEGELSALARYRLLVENTAEIVLFVREDGLVVDANQAAADAYGYSRSELAGQPVSLLCHRRDDHECVFLQAMTGTSPVRSETRHRRRDGSTFPVEVSAVSTSVGAHRIVLGIVRDLTERRRGAAFQHVLHEIDSRILRNEPLDAILRLVCARVASEWELLLVQVGLKGEAGRVEIREWAGAGADFLGSIEVRWDDSPLGRGPTGTAIRTGRPRRCTIATDPDFEPWREKALANGLTSALALPLTSGDSVLGAMTLFASGDRTFGTAELEQLRGFADQVALSLRNAREMDEIRLQRAALESVANAVVVTDARGAIAWANPAFTALSGWTLDEVRGRSPGFLKSGNHSPAFYRQMWETLLSGGVWSGELWNRRKDGTLYAEEMTITPVRDEAGRIGHFVAVKQEITERKRQEERIRYLAMHDVLTDLPNRRAFEAALDRATRKARAGLEGAILIVDLDNFKAVNDTLGHFAGDHVLAELAGVLRGALRPGDFLARLGGDEFALVLEETPVSEARAIGERLRQAVAEHDFVSEGRRFDLTVSIGVAPIGKDADSKGTLIRADSGLYTAKDQGRNRVVALESGDEAGAGLAAASRWAARVRDALRKDRFVLHYQPVVRLGSGAPEHYEALLRLRAEDGTIVGPEEFLSSAERFGLMPQVDLWVTETVLAFLAANPGDRVFVNLSGSSLNDAGLLAEVEARIRAAGLPPGRLAFEITETTAVTDIASTQNWIRRLKALGCLFALDDFGVGFSSFAYLRALPVDYIKIDRSFIQNVDSNQTNRAVVEAVRTVARTLGKEVIAEGVESEAHESILREIGIEHGQGFHWGRPHPVDPETGGFARFIRR